MLVYQWFQERGKVKFKIFIEKLFPTIPNYSETKTLIAHKSSHDVKTALPK